MLAVLAALALQTPWFTTTHQGQTDWLQQNGKPFWSFGVDCVDDGIDPAKNDPKNPGYSGLSIFPDERAWTLAVKDQLKTWGFNTLGAWSDPATFEKHSQALPYAVCLHLGAYDLAPWHDLFSKEMETAMDGAAKAQITKIKDDPNLIGYFSDNELGWWDDTLFATYLKFPQGSPGRNAILDCLKTHYQTIDNLKKDWFTDAQDFDQIKDLKLRPGQNGQAAVKEWTRVLADHYYQLAHDLIRRYDSNHLILGDRYCQYYTLPVVQASSKYIDVASTNLGADWNNGDIAPFYLETLHHVTGKPVMITEFYMAAMENRSGDRNSSGGFPIVQTQAQRAAAFANYVRQVALTPSAVGAHWFQYADEPGKGRGDGEDYNMGLVDVKGVPYQEITRAARETNPQQLHAQAKPATYSTQVPLGPDDPMSGLKTWDKTHGCLPCETEDRMADLFACWKPEGLYLALYSMDYADKSLYQDEKIPEVDRDHFTITLPNQANIDVRFGADTPPILTGPENIKVVSSGGLKLTTIVFIPNALLPDRTTFPIKAEYQSHGRRDTTDWNTALQLPK
jgi:hypothetical protein